MSTNAQVFQDMVELAIGELAWLEDTVLKGVSGAIEPAEHRAAVGAFRGSLDYGKVVASTLISALGDYRQACGCIVFARVASDWYLTGMWLRHGEDSPKKKRFIEWKEGNTREHTPEFKELLKLARKTSGKKIYFDKLEKIRPKMNSQIHGNMDAISSVLSGRIAKEWCGLDFLGELSAVLCLTAFQSSSEILGIHEPATGREIISNREYMFEQEFKKLQEERER